MATLKTQSCVFWVSFSSHFLFWVMKVKLYDGALEIKNGTISSKQSIQVMQYNTGAIKNMPNLSEVRELLTMACLEGQSI